MILLSDCISGTTTSGTTMYFTKEPDPGVQRVSGLSFCVRGQWDWARRHMAHSDTPLWRSAPSAPPATVFLSTVHWGRRHDAQRGRRLELLWHACVSSCQLDALLPPASPVPLLQTDTHVCLCVWCYILGTSACLLHSKYKTLRLSRAFIFPPDFSVILN